MVSRWPRGCNAANATLPDGRDSFCTPSLDCGNKREAGRSGAAFPRWDHLALQLTTLAY